ncbi:hypothetical protein ABTK87_19795, partial [Acinetobacter baumannii]
EPPGRREEPHGTRQPDQDRELNAVRAVFVDASPALAAVAGRLPRPDGLDLAISQTPDIKPPDLPALLAGAPIAIIDHSFLPTD